MRKITTIYISLFFATIFILSSCSSQTSIHGLWQDTNEQGTIEFKENGEVIIIDNMSATVTGTFILEGKESIRFEFTATDIMKDSLQPMEKTIVSANIIKFNNDDLLLKFVGRTEVEHYKRVH